MLTICNTLHLENKNDNKSKVNRYSHSNKIYIAHTHMWTRTHSQSAHTQTVVHRNTDRHRHTEHNIHALKHTLTHIKIHTETEDKRRQQVIYYCKRLYIPI